MSHSDHSTPLLQPLAVYTAAETAAILRETVRKLRTQIKAGLIQPLNYCSGKTLIAGAEIMRFIGVTLTPAAHDFPALAVLPPQQETR